MLRKRPILVSAVAVFGIVVIAGAYVVHKWYFQLRITVNNVSSSQSLQNVTLLIGQTVYTLGEVKAGELTTISVECEGTCNARIRYQTESGTDIDAVIGGYLEESYYGLIAVDASEAGVVAVNEQVKISHPLQFF